MPSPRNNPIDFDYLAKHHWWDRVDRRGPNDCWPWLLSTASHGYGQTWDGSRVLLAHRVAWALGNRSQIPDDMTVDHVCRNIICCNPRHLRLLSNVANASDNGFNRRTQCPKGHPYNMKNTYIQPSNGSRRCRACAQAKF